MAVVTGVPPAATVPVVLALGANLGDRAATLRSAVASLDAVAGLTVHEVSAPVQTDPVGGPDQPAYLNAAVLATTSLAPGDLLAACHDVEAAHQRVREVRWGPRTLDVDVVAYGEPGSPEEVVSDDPLLTLPHPRAHERGFVLAPWASVRPDAVLRCPDGAVVPVAVLLERAPDRAGVRTTEGLSLW